MFRLCKNKIYFHLVYYPSRADLKDGYFQRVLAIDSVLSGFTRYYVNYENFAIIPVIRKIKEGVFEIETSKYNPFGLLLITGIVLFSGNIYLHSILRLKSSFHKLLFLVARNRIVDLHGVVPEEFLLYDKQEESNVFDKVEKFAIKYANTIISVSNNLTVHIKEKYSVSDNKHFILLPIFSQEKTVSIEKIFFKS